MDVNKGQFLSEYGVIKKENLNYFFTYLFCFSIILFLLTVLIFEKVEKTIFILLSLLIISVLVILYYVYKDNKEAINSSIIKFYENGVEISELSWHIGTRNGIIYKGLDYDYFNYNSVTILFLDNKLRVFRVNSTEIVISEKYFDTLEFTNEEIKKIKEEFKKHNIIL